MTHTMIGRDHEVARIEATLLNVQQGLLGMILERDARLRDRGGVKKVGSGERRSVEQGRNPWSRQHIVS
jgi:hypothetical protein